MPMKTSVFFIAAALSAGGLAARGADQPAPTAQVQVNFDHPEKYTDANDHYGDQDATNSPYLPQLRAYIQKKAARYLTHGEKLTITFTDIDLAGEFEPWRGPAAQDVRVIKAIYVPRLKFDYRVTDANGNVIKAGHANVTDLNFQQDIAAFALQRDDPLVYEKNLLDDWLSRELSDLKKK